MPREHKSRREVIDAIKSLPSMADLLSKHEGHFEYELDLEVIVYGRNYNGKKVGPYVKLLTYEPGETIIGEGDWGGNTFYAVVKGRADVFQGPGQPKVAELPPGAQFGEMSVLAGVPRNATIKAPPSQDIQILEVQRPALRLLRKLSKFGESLDKTYRLHGKRSILEKLKATAGLSDEVINHLSQMCQFRVFSKNHVLFRERTPVDRLYLIKEGWMRRSIETDAPQAVEDFLGGGYCFGLEGYSQGGAWMCTGTLLGRTEVLEISIRRLNENPAVRDAVVHALAAYAPPAQIGERVNYKPDVRQQMLEAQERLIDTGLVDGNNLLVMDMDMCVRCGNCSLACHHIHGRSRLVRRGIHVTRLEAPRRSAEQSLLSPSVCMHCKDPECLTGCPTGAIGRFGEGQIDINQSTCIGCGDCASQCPYNAISLMPRKKEAATNGSFAHKLLGLFRLKADPLPPAVEQTDELVAIKCNLCQGTSMNPEGSKRQAYSCEENCPTGALARISPRQYFAEIGAIEGFALKDRAHAFGRNIHQKDSGKRALHTLGILLTLLLGGGAAYGLWTYGMGGSIFGFLNMRWITGLVGLAGIAVVMTYPMRRQVYTKRRGPLRYWMLLHSYAGIIAGIMLLAHGGTDSGGLLTTILMISFDMVILSGLFGIFCYFVVPRILTSIEGEPLLIDDLKGRREELQKELADIGSLPAEPLRTIVRGKVVPQFVSFGFLLRQYLKREKLDEMYRNAKVKFNAEAAALTNPKDRANLERAIEDAVTLRRVDALIYLHRLLKVWLPPHVLFTSLMLALLLVHIIQVIYYSA
jgi:Fe-S-cluster-containing dehydrogenase component/CRP-like cAMP-binding protein